MGFPSLVFANLLLIVPSTAMYVLINQIGLPSTQPVQLRTVTCCLAARMRSEVLRLVSSVNERVFVTLGENRGKP